jgi:peptidoglycan/xylan/chitin deacetylase (PgdA/CDA1 family)
MHPGGTKTALLISADLELAWAWRYAIMHPHPLVLAQQKAEQTRRNMPLLLDLFDRYNVPVTWGVVGHLFLEGCERVGGRAHPDLPRPAYFANEHWRYINGDWYDADPCSDFRCDPAWYAPDLIQAILSAKVKHEIACHTFSHIDCSDEHCPPEVMDAELGECQRLARRCGVELRSFVFPGNRVGNLASLKKYGFTAYRWHGRYELDLPQRDEHGLWRIPGGVCWEKPEAWPVKAWIKALKRCVDRALETGTVLHLWFHPSCEPVDVEEVFPAVLDHAMTHRDLQIVTMDTIADRLTLIGGA